MKLFNASALCLFIAVSTACAHEPAIQELSPTAIPADEVSILQKDLDQAVIEQTDVLAPKNFEQAQSALKEAQADIKDKDDAKDILRKVALGKAYLTKAHEYAKIAKANINEVVEARRLAAKEGAKDAFAAEFKDADSDLKNVTADFEDNKTAIDAESRTAILTRYLDLEVRAIRKSNLGHVEAELAQAKKAEAADWAPQSLLAAEKSLKDADNYIIANRHETQRIKELSDLATASVEKLKLINKEARSGTKSTGEQAALKLFTEREKVAAQKTELAVAKTQLNQAEAKQSDAAAALAVSTAARSNDLEFNKKFERAQSQFSKNEAELFRQGDSLIIRLKSLEFTNAKATLKGSNFPLLAKVNSVIADLNANSVVVEGHTDSVGSRLSNEQLSEARAEAVKSYFESNNPGNARFSATGFGFQKPIATNKTASGRAQNRRVDVVIHAVSLQ